MGLQSQDLEFDSETVKHYYLCNYKPKSQGWDNLSESLLHFKNGWSVDVEAWTECSLSELEKVSLEKPSLVLRALTSDEMSVSPLSDKPLDLLGRKMADQFNIRYKPNLLIKSRLTKKLKFLSASEREDEMVNVYSIEKPNFIKGFNSIVILDDILTSGATIHSIVKAIRMVRRSCKIYVFTLALTNRNAILNQVIHLSGYAYEWEDKTGWTVAEDGDYATQLNNLKTTILKDAFYENS
jgi:hypoxanthine phosphoribosyltransferase